MKKAIVTALEAGTSIRAGGSRLLRGNCEEHECLEAAAARFFGAQTALFFGGGYVAKVAVLTTLPQRDDLLVLDSLIHASIHEGARAGRAAFRITAHNDPQVIESAICDWRAAGGAGQVWIVVESLYSMDGDFAPLEDLLAIADTGTMRSWLWTKLMPPAFTASRGEGSQGRLKDAKISWLFIPAARRWELPARLSPPLACCAIS